MRFTNLLSNLIVEQSRFQVLYDKLVKPSPKAKPEPGKKAKGIMDFNTLKEERIIEIIEAQRDRCKTVKEIIDESPHGLPFRLNFKRA